MFLKEQKIIRFIPVINFFVCAFCWFRMNFKYYIPHRYKNTFKLGFKTAFMLFIFWLPYSIIVRFCNIEIINSILTFILGYYMMFVPIICLKIRRSILTNKMPKKILQMRIKR